MTKQEQTHKSSTQDAIPTTYTPAEVAMILRCSAMTIKRMIRRNELRAVKVGTRLRVPRDVVEEFLRQGSM